MEQRIELSPELTAIALAYKNKNYIAEEIFPKVPVSTSTFKYKEYDKNNYFLVPETKIGERGIPNNVEYRGVEKEASVEDHALEEYIPVSKRKEYEDKGIDIDEKATNQVVGLLKTRKEIIVSSLLANVNSYGGNGGNVKTLNSNEKMNNDNSNALKLILTAANELLYAPNILVCSRKVLNALRMNPYIVDACGTASKKAGVVSVEELENKLSLKIYAGDSIVNTAKKGQPASLAIAWGDHISLIRIDKTADTDGGITFGFEAEYERIQVGKYFDGKPGTQGCDIVKAFYSSKYLNICADAGYLLKDVLG